MAASSNSNADWYITHLRRANVFLLLFASIFWVWAMINTATQDYVDLGVVSFLTVIVTSAYMLWIIKGDGDEQRALYSTDRCRTCSLYLPSVSHVVVAVHYGVGASMTEHEWGKMYCTIFTGLWFGIFIVYLTIVQKTRRDKGDSAETVVGDPADVGDNFDEEEEAAGTPRRDETTDAGEMT